MEILKVNRDNLASVIMGKTIQHPWRGQPDVVISVPFGEWLEFVKNYQDLLCNRNPLSYKRMLASGEEDVAVRYFLYEISWALYSELACSSNISRDATLILPYFDNGKLMSIEDVIAQAYAMSDKQLLKCEASLKAATRNYLNLSGISDMSLGTVDTSILSKWNMLVYRICMFIQSRSSNKVATEKFNIDWRI